MARPHSGKWYEELTVGLVVQHALTRTVTETDNVLFTTLTLNPQPLHLDHEFAAATEFGRPLVNSFFTLGLVGGIVTFEHRGFNQRDELVCRFRRNALMRRRPTE